MMRLNIGDNEFKIKFAYEPTLKGRVISKITKMGNIAGEDGDIDYEKMEDFLLLLPEILLVGLQKFHQEEYGYDYDTEEGKNVQLKKAFDLIEEYSDQENEGLISLFNDLQEEMKTDSFLAKTFQKEQKEAELEEEMAQTDAEIVEMPAIEEKTES